MISESESIALDFLGIIPTSIHVYLQKYQDVNIWIYMLGYVLWVCCLLFELKYALAICNKSLFGGGVVNFFQMWFTLCMEKESVVRPFDGKAASVPPGNTNDAPKEKIMNKKTIIIFFTVVLLGAGSGFVFASNRSSSVVQVNSGTKLSQLKSGTVFGSADEKAFKDNATGILKKGGIEGEGAYHLERSGGVSQNVYLTSSVLDLSQLVGRQVKVWGQTNAAQTAGWLMDVGRAQIIN